MQIESYRRIRLSVNRFGLGLVLACFTLGFQGNIYETLAGYDAVSYTHLTLPTSDLV